MKNESHLPEWEILRVGHAYTIGYLPDIILNEVYDSRPVVEQVNDRYAHGGGWHAMSGFKWEKLAQRLTYPGDKPMHANARFQANSKETVYVFDGGWVLVDRGPGNWEVARLD